MAAITVTTSTTTAHAAKHARPCPPAGARVLASDVDARVYRIRPKKLPGITDFYACMTRGRGHRYLGYETDGLSTFVYRTFRLASPYVAYVQYTYSTAGSHVTPTIRNIRTGTKVKVDVADAVYALEVTRRGGLLILWGGQNPRVPFPPREPPQLLYRSRLGQRFVLDTGDGIDRSSLAVSRDGTRAYWLKDGIAATAVLP